MNSLGTHPSQTVRLCTEWIYRKYADTRGLALKLLMKDRFFPFVAKKDWLIPLAVGIGGGGGNACKINSKAQYLTCPGRFITAQIPKFIQIRSDAIKYCLSSGIITSAGWSNTTAGNVCCCVARQNAIRHKDAEHKCVWRALIDFHLDKSGCTAGGEHWNQREWILLEAQQVITP